MLKLLNKVKVFFYSLWIRIGLALHSTQKEFETAPIDEVDPTKKQEQKKRHHNPVLQRMEDGVHDEKYVQHYYEILKKADKFLKHSSEEQIQLAAQKHGMNLAKKDRWGKRYEHFGFYDPKSKHYGKTLGEAIEAQVNERKTEDDDFPVMYMINNKKKNDGFAKLTDLEVKDDKVQLKNDLERVKESKFKVMIIREQDTLNKLEQLTEFLHVKRVDETHRILEFFVETKFKLNTYDESSDIFKQLTTINQVWFSDEWGQRFGYTVTNYRKRVPHSEQYEVIKFDATEIIKA